MKTARLRRALDYAIVTVIVLGAFYYLPLLADGVEAAVTKASKEPSWQPRYARAFFILGLVPLVGSALMLVPCLSLCRPPLGAGFRRFLALLCLLPLALSLYGALLAPRELWPAYATLGVLFSLGVWLFALPLVVGNCSIIELVERLSRARRR